MRQVWDTTKEQRCWVHKTANVLDKLPKGVQPKAKEMLHDIYLAETKAEAEKAFDLFVRTYEAKYPEGDGVPGQGPGCVADVLRLPGGALDAHPDDEPDRERVRDGAAADDKTKGSGSRTACLTMVFKLMESRIKGLAIVERFAAAGRGHQGDDFIDGIKEKPAA